MSPIPGAVFFVVWFGLFSIICGVEELIRRRP